MSWKNGDRHQPPPGAWSIATRLTVLYTLSALVILSLALAFVYWKISADLHEQEESALVDEMSTLRDLIADHPEGDTFLRQEVEQQSAARLFARFYARITEESGEFVMETAGITNLIPLSSFPPPLKVSESLRRGRVWKTADGRAYLCQAARARVALTKQKVRIIQLALEVTQQEDMLVEYRGRLFRVLVFGVLGSAVVGFLIARRGLRPLQDITEATQRITATQLNERISPRAWPSELTSLATEFDGMLSRLEDSFSRLSQFSTDIAHELRTPINNLMGEVDVALTRSRTAQEYRQVLESSLEECGRLSRIIDSLLFVARAENTEVKIKAAWFDATREIQAVLEFYEALAEEEDVTLEAHGTATLYGDMILFRRALSNLLANAIRHTPRGGKVDVSIKNQEDQAVVVRVVDNGIGIPREHLPKIFDRFYRVDPARSRHAEGTGLGLAIVKSIMELHGGSVTVESEVGAGTTFILRFPTQTPAKLPEPAVLSGKASPAPI